MSNPENYTVGWVCAIVTEYVAARQFLDGEHDRPEYVSSGDNNVYTLGSIAGHNVVIAAPPDGEYGTSMAATVARDMVHSFSNIRIGLMVGIGGGAPSSKNDIRLGDIVVSSPGNNSGGVLQYDYGKTIQNQAFQTTGYLNQPPPLLRAAVTDFRARCEDEGHELEDAVAAVFNKKPKLRKKYDRPDQASDRLYRADVIHPPDLEDVCNSACTAEPTCIISRLERDEEEDNPAIHYGLIASANTLMKDALLRDKLAQERGVVCFEMEAAGLMNHFPCLVIRGICDYSDTHKNKEWQGYAAMVAAAYARDILRRIAPSRIEAERTIHTALSIVHKGVQDVQKQTCTTQNIVEDIHMERQRDKWHDWLAPSDSSTNYNKASALHHPGTGQWLLDSAEYAAWKEEQGSFLWLHGMPGCGKTILSSTIIKDLKKYTAPLSQDLVLPGFERHHALRKRQGEEDIHAGPRKLTRKSASHIHTQTAVNHTAENELNPVTASRVLLYFFFDFSDLKKQSLEDVIRSLVCQLCSSNSELEHRMQSLYSSYQDGQQQPSIKSLLDTFMAMVEQAGEVYIVLDALDECKTRRGAYTEGMLACLGYILSFPGSNVHLLATSRPEQDIEVSVKGLCHNQYMLSLGTKGVSDDICLYVRTIVREHEDLKRWRSRPGVQKEIEDCLLQKADGMFRWVSCQLELLKDCLDLPTLRAALATLPQTLDATYARILDNIPKSYRHHTFRILQFLVYSESPLSVENAIELVVIDVDKDRGSRFLPENRLPDATEILKYCSSLVNYWRDSDHASHGRSEAQSESSDEESSRGCAWLQLAHFSVKEYLTSNRLQSSVSAFLGEEAARTAIAHVSLVYVLELSYQFPACEQDRSQLPQCTLEYCASNWCTHAAIAEEHSSVVASLALEFLQSEFARSFIRIPGFYYVTPSAVQSAAYAGLKMSLNILLASGAEVNETMRGYFECTALDLASHYGRTSSAQVLLDSGANIGPALTIAVQHQHESLVRLLLERGADPNGSSRRYSDNLSEAIRTGNENIVRLLLDKGADANRRSYLSRSITYGDENIVHLLFEKGADPNRDDSLQVASSCGKEKIVRSFLDKSTDAKIYSSLRLASKEGNENIVRLLLKRIVQPNRPTSLAVVLACGVKDIAQSLLDQGADIDFASNGSHVYKTAYIYPVVFASVCPYGLHRGVDMMLAIASIHQQEAIIQMLLDRRPKFNIGSPLVIASFVGNEAIVQALLDKCIEMHFVVGIASLAAASLNKRENIIRILLDKGADRDFGNALPPIHGLKRSSNFKIRLQTLFRKERIIRMFFAKLFDIINIRTIMDRLCDALCIGVHNHNTTFVARLLKEVEMNIRPVHGLDINVKPALQIALEAGYHDTHKVLSDYKAKLDWRKTST